MAFSGARIFKKPVPIGATPDCPDCPQAFSPFYLELLADVFKGSLPKSLKPSKGMAVGDVPNNAFTAVGFGATDYDDGGYVSVTQPDRLVVPAGKAGPYRAAARWHSGLGVKPGVFIYAWLVRSDQECLDMATLVATGGQDNTTPLLYWEGKLKDNDFLKVVLLHAQGSPMSEGTLKFGTWLSLVALDPGASPGPGPGPNPTPTPTPVP